MAIYKGKSDYSAAETQKLLGEVMDKNRVLLACQRHNYVASDIPPEPRGCKDCWQAYWWHQIASTPPHLRKARLDAAVAMLTEANELAAQGKFDFEVFEHAEISTEKSSV